MRFWILGILVLTSLPGAAQTPGTIVFSSEPIASGMPPQASPPVFSPPGTIYALATFSGPLQRLPITKRVTVSLKIFEKTPGGETFLDYYDIGLSGSSMLADSLPLELVPDPLKARSYSQPEWHFGSFGKKVDGPAAMCDILARLAPGRHLLVLRLEQDYQPVASGELVVEGADFGVYSQVAEALRQSRPRP